MQLARALGITAFVAVLGAVGGALGGIAITLFFTVGRLLGGTSLREVGLSDLAFIALVAGVIGIVFGVVLGPLYAWTLLRRAPLWRAIGETALAAALGAGVGLFAPIVMLAPYTLAVLFSTVAALRLRHAVRARDEASRLPSAS